jgi:hypothetical protein
MPEKFSLYQDQLSKKIFSFLLPFFGTTIEENYELIKDIYIQIEPFKSVELDSIWGNETEVSFVLCIHTKSISRRPTTGVDPVSRKEFWQMLKRLQQKGITQ